MPRGHRARGLFVYKILVVDDETQMRRVLRGSLLRSGYEVAEAESGEEAITRLAAEPYDFVLLDLNLPGIDGIQTCRAIRTISPVPVVIISIRSSQEDKDAARSAGADNYLTKPFGLTQLLTCIRELTGDSSHAT